MTNTFFFFTSTHTALPSLILPVDSKPLSILGNVNQQFLWNLPDRGQSFLGGMKKAWRGFQDLFQVVGAGEEGAGNRRDPKWAPYASARVLNHSLWKFIRVVESRDILFHHLLIHTRNIY